MFFSGHLTAARLAVSFRICRVKLLLFVRQDCEAADADVDVAARVGEDLPGPAPLDPNDLMAAAGAGAHVDRDVALGILGSVRDADRVVAARRGTINFGGHLE